MDEIDFMDEMITRPFRPCRKFICEEFGPGPGE